MAYTDTPLTDEPRCPDCAHEEGCPCSCCPPVAAGKPYGRHSAIVTSDRLLTAYERWYDSLSAAELDAISMVRAALQRIAEPRPLAPCGTPAAYRRHLRKGEPTDQACRDAHAREMRERNAATKNEGPL